MKTRYPKYITCDSGKGSDGKERFYYRRPGIKKRIHGTPWTPSFMAAYENAKAGVDAKTCGTKDGTFKWLCDQYFESGEFKALDKVETQPRRKNNLNSICLEPTFRGSKQLAGDMTLASWSKKAVRSMRDRYPGLPSRGNSYLKTMKALFAWAIEAEHCEDDPAKDVKLLPPKNSRGHHSWTVEEVEEFEAAFPIGTKEHLALGLLLYSSQRDSDVIRFGKSFVKLRNVFDDDGQLLFDEETNEPAKRKWIAFTQHKNRNRKPIDLEIPLRPELEEIIAATPDIGEDPFLLNHNGKPFTVVRFCEWFGKACLAAGVPGRAHGLRKASAARLAERGATDKEIMAITGHTTLAEVARYTKAANQKRLASAATAKMKPKKRVAG